MHSSFHSGGEAGVLERVHTCVRVFAELIVDFVPVDLVINALLAAAWFEGTGSCLEFSTLNTKP